MRRALEPLSNMAVAGALFGFEAGWVALKGGENEPRVPKENSSLVVLFH